MITFRRLQLFKRAAMCLALFGCLMTARQARALPPAIPADISSNSITPQLDKEIDEHFKERRLPGLVVLYARDGLLTYKRTLGYADKQNQVKMTEHHIGRLNSVSKWVGGILAMQQVEKGNLNLNASAKSYIPDLPAHHTYKVEDLLSCRSGVRHYGETKSPESPSGWDNDHYNSAIVAAPKFWLDPLAAPVDYYHYSTHGYTILGACMEYATGTRIKDIIKQDLNQKYGLTTLAAEDVTQSNSKRMKLYTWKGRGREGRFGLGRNVEVERDDPSWKVLGGGVEASPMDLLKLGILLGDGKIVSPQNVQKMMTRVDPLDSYALGCNHAIENGYHVMAKSGSFKGSNAYIWLVPERRMVMVVMANRDEADVSGLGKKLRSIVLNPDNASSTSSDLVVENFKRTGTPQFKNGNWEIPFSFKVVNQGGAGANNSFVNGIQYGTKYRWSGFMDALPGKGASDTATGTVKIPDAGKLYAGRTLQLVAWADAPIAAADTSMPSYGRIDESNDNNNKATLSVKLPGGIGNFTGQKPPQPSFPGSSNPTRVPTNTPPKGVKVAIPGATLIPPSRSSIPPRRVPTTRPTPPQRVPTTRPATRPTRVPTARPAAPTRVPTSRPGRPAPIGRADLVVRSIRFVPNRPQMAYVTVGNAGQGPARASVLRLTVRQIHGTPVGRTMDVRVPALQPAESKVLTVDASKILPNNIRLQVTTFRVDADITKVVSESDETNNLEWHMP